MLLAIAIAVSVTVGIVLDRKPEAPAPPPKSSGATMPTNVQTMTALPLGQVAELPASLQSPDLAASLKSSADGVSPRPGMPSVLTDIIQQRNRPETDKAAAKARAGEGSTCIAESASDLQDGVRDDTCEIILLSNTSADAYKLASELIITRRVTILGNPLTLPTIDARSAERGFNVTSGGYLDLRHVRLRQGSGRLRPRYVGGDSTRPSGMVSKSCQWIVMLISADMWYSSSWWPTQIQEVRGGNIFFGRGSLGGSFVGVHFIIYSYTSEDVQLAVQATVAGVGLRVLGGDVLMLAGTACKQLSRFEARSTSSYALSLGPRMLVP